MTPKNKKAAQYVNITAVMKHFLVVLAASLVLTRIESEDIRGVNYPHEIHFLHDYTLYREHDIFFTSPVLDFAPRQYMFMFLSILAFFVGKGGEGCHLRVVPPGQLLRRPSTPKPSSNQVLLFF